MNRKTKKQFLHVLKSVAGARNYRKIFEAYSFSKLKRKSPKLYALLAKNKRMKDTHKGERCFIFGNGPSLKELDFSLFKDEFVFSVNYFHLIDGFEKAEPNIHLVIDPCVFDMREDLHTDYDHNIKCFYDMFCLPHKPIVFLPSFAYEWAVKNKISKMPDVRYLHIMHQAIDADIDEIDLSKGTFYFETVIEYAIETAIYLGFSEIYLLGCEATVFFGTCDMILEGKVNPKNAHAYAKEVDIIEDTSRQLVQTWSMHELMYSNYKVFLEYKRLRDYCDRHGIKLRNCTDKTLITEIEKEDLHKVLGRKSQGRYC